MIKKVRVWVYGQKVIVETDASTLVIQLNRNIIDLPGAMITRQITWLRLFNFEVRYIPGKLNGVADGLSRRGKQLEDDISRDKNAFINAEFNYIQIRLSIYRVYVGPSRVNNGVEAITLDEQGNYNESSKAIAHWLLTL